MVNPLKTCDYKPGKFYVLQKNVKVRKNAGFNFPQKLYSELNATDKQKAFDQMFAVFKEGTKIMVLKVIESSGQVWLKCSAGYLCAKNGKEIYIC